MNMALSANPNLVAAAHGNARSTESQTRRSVPTTALNQCRFKSRCGMTKAIADVAAVAVEAHVNLSHTIINCSQDHERNCAAVDAPVAISAIIPGTSMGLPGSSACCQCGTNAFHPTQARPFLVEHAECNAASAAKLPYCQFTADSFHC